MQATTLSVTLAGLDARLVRVEVDSGRGLPAFQLVGLPEAAVRESRVRVRAALALMDIDLREYVVTVNLAPGYLRKSGSSHDLAIAVGTYVAIAELEAPLLAETLLLGELSLRGDVRPVRGVLPALMGAQRCGLKRAIVPPGNAAEAAAVGGLEVLVASTLAEVIDALKGETTLAPAASLAACRPQRPRLLVDLAEVRGQLLAKSALEVAAAGSHPLLMIGPPGSGKTMLARRMPTILPELTEREALAVTCIHSVAGLLHSDDGIVLARPMRAPHHTLSSAALLGGGDPIRPGEMSLAHHGVLFLDELLEFRRHVIEGMRQPLESGEVTICRARTRATFPARPLLLAAINPCPCGYAGSDRPCTCRPHQIRQYQARLSGPLLDRMDLSVKLQAVDVSALSRRAGGEAESSATVRTRVEAARAIQADRARRGEVSTPYNVALTPTDLDRVAAPDAASLQLLSRVVQQLGLSARGYMKLRRLARTLADLEGATAVTERHFAEALGKRVLDTEPITALAS